MLLLHPITVVPLEWLGAEDPKLTVGAVELYALAQSQRFVGNSRLFDDVAGTHIAAAAATLPPNTVAAAREGTRARAGFVGHSRGVVARVERVEAVTVRPTLFRTIPVVPRKFVDKNR